MLSLLLRPRWQPLRTLRVRCDIARHDCFYEICGLSLSSLTSFSFPFLLRSLSVLSYTVECEECPECSRCTPRGSLIVTSFAAKFRRVKDRKTKRKKKSATLRQERMLSGVWRMIARGSELSRFQSRVKAVILGIPRQSGPPGEESRVYFERYNSRVRFQSV